MTFGGDDMPGEDELEDALLAVARHGSRDETMFGDHALACLADAEGFLRMGNINEAVRTIFIWAQRQDHMAAGRETWADQKVTKRLLSLAPDEYERTKTWRDNEIGEILSISQRRVAITALTPEMIHIEDIAHALSRLCRYNGHVSGFISVAEHSVAVSRLVAKDHPEFALEALLHDAWEAYGGDMVRPLKMLGEMWAYRYFEEAAEKVIAEKFGLTYPWPDPVIEADRTQLYVEMDTWRYNEAHMTLPNAARGIFMAEYRKLAAERGLAV